jgi:hypothetical protein
MLIHLCPYRLCGGVAACLGSGVCVIPTFGTTVTEVNCIGFWWGRVHFTDLCLDFRIILVRPSGKMKRVDMHWIRLIQFREERWAVVKNVMENWV